MGNMTTGAVAKSYYHRLVAVAKAVKKVLRVVLSAHVLSNCATLMKHRGQIHVRQVHQRLNYMDRKVQ